MAIETHSCILGWSLTRHDLGEISTSLFPFPVF